jgi:hypothetical protein
MKRTLCSLLVATLPFGSVLTDAPKEKDAKGTLVYQHELPNPADREWRRSLGRELMRVHRHSSFSFAQSRLVVPLSLVG